MHCNRIFSFLAAMLLLFPVLTACGRARAAEEEPGAAPASYLSTLTFLGDSTTAHMQQRSSVEPARIWASKDRYLNLDPRITYAKILAPDTGEEELITSVAGRLRPERLVITLGIDYGVYYYRDRPELFRLYYEKLLDAIAQATPDTELILQSVFPVGRTARAVTNEMVSAANRVIAAIAADRALLYVDQTEVLADGDGFLRPEYCYSEDGLHLTESAYSAILAHLLAVGEGVST